MKVVVDIPIEITDEYVVVGKWRFNKCDDCPLSDEEIVLMLIANMINSCVGSDVDWDIIVEGE